MSKKTRSILVMAAIVWFAAAALDAAEKARVPRPAMPEIKQPVAFNTAEADRILEALQVFPADNPWNANVRTGRSTELGEHHCLDRTRQAVPLQHRHGLRPRAAGSGPSGGQDRRLSGRVGQGAVSRAGQRPIEGWPADFLRNPAHKTWALEDVQRDRYKQDGDRHAMVVDPTNRMLYEFYQARKTDAGWEAARPRRST